MSILNQEFSKDIESAVNNYTGPMSKREVLSAYFKSSVAKVLEIYINTYNTHRIESDLLSVMKPELISAFTAAVVDDAQLSDDKYGKLFDQAMKEIVQGAHSRQQESVDFGGNAYRMRGGGLYVPPSIHA